MVTDFFLSTTGFLSDHVPCYKHLQADKANYFEVELLKLDRLLNSDCRNYAVLHSVEISVHQQHLIIHRGHDGPCHHFQQIVKLSRSRVDELLTLLF